MNLKLTYTLTLIFVATLFTFSCNNNQTATNTSNTADSLAACENPATIMDPNNTKPMALMMRQMAANADTMKSMLLRGEQLDSTKFPFIRFYLVEPTDPKVLEPQFFENARLHQESYKALFTHTEDQKKYYNLMINSCIKCHESYCSGPLKRIRKFPI